MPLTRTVKLSSVDGEVANVADDEPERASDRLGPLYSFHGRFSEWYTYRKTPSVTVSRETFISEAQRGAGNPTSSGSVLRVQIPPANPGNA